MLRVAIAGLGTVGAGVVRLLQKNAEAIAARAGRAIEVKAVAARDRHKKRDCDLPDVQWVQDARQLAVLPGIDVVVELIGGAEGVAKELAEDTLSQGRNFVMANKALIAAHGKNLAMLAEKNIVALGFEAAVAGGIPVIKTVREGLAANDISAVSGILNGTCNYILTRMQAEGLDFASVLRDAQDKGYAEANPAADIDGHDTANKLAILAALAFGTAPDLGGITVEGIRHVSQLDIKLAEELGYRIKLLGLARLSEGGMEQRVGPCLVPLHSSLARIQGPTNAVTMRGDFVGDITLEGAGAGAEPTASAVVADLIDIARGSRRPAFGIPATKLAAAKPAAKPQAAEYYLRLQAVDKPGVVADIAAVLRDEAISIRSLLQHGVSTTDSVPVVIVTHAAAAASMQAAVAKISKLGAVTAPPCLMRIEN